MGFAAEFQTAPSPAFCQDHAAMRRLGENLNDIILHPACSLRGHRPTRYLQTQQHSASSRRHTERECDFCGVVNASITYHHAPAFELALRNARTGETLSIPFDTSDWHACITSASLIDADDWIGVIERAA